MRGYPQFSLWISIALVKIYIPCVIINQGKNTINLVGTVLKLKQKLPSHNSIWAWFVFLKIEVGVNREN